MSLYVLSYVKNMEYRNKIVEFEKINETINMLKDYEIEVTYITKIKEDDPEIKKLLGIYKRTKKQILKWKYGNEIERTSITLGSKPTTLEKFLNG